MAKFRLLMVGAFSVLIGVSCIKRNNKFDRSQSQIESRYFSDIDLYHLKGLNEMLSDELRYPYIRIDSVDKDEKNVIFFYDNSFAYKLIYKRQGSSWVSSHIVKDQAEGITFHFYQFVNENRIVEIEYAGDPLLDGSLASLKIVEKNVITSYVFDYEEMKINIKPTFEVNRFPLDKCFRKSISTYWLENGVLTYETQTVDPNTSRISAVDKRCYLIRNLSYFWWSIAGHRLKMVDC